MNVLFALIIGFIGAEFIWHIFIVPGLTYLDNKTKWYSCEGCGNPVKHIHNHFGYNSCSEDCDDFLNDIFSEMKY